LYILLVWGWNYGVGELCWDCYKSGKLIVYCTGVSDGMMVMDSSTAIVLESGKLILYFTVVTFRFMVLDSFAGTVT
jgi:hypothetical protein